ncbi:MAG: SufD family Fe-S cluster assembly protein [Candidatus Moraniibacteriota bacterium]
MHIEFIPQTEEKKTYAIRKAEQRVFVLHNASGDYTFALEHPEAEVRVFAFYTATHEHRYALRITQHHLSPRTLSSVSVRGILSDTAALDYQGLIRIEEEASGSAASQESRGLLLSNGASHISQPALEILPEDVSCHHRASVAPINEEAITALGLRGIDPQSAKTLLTNGFLAASLEEMEKLLGASDELLHFRETLAQEVAAFAV